MRKEIRTELLIPATPAEVWRVFSDFSAYPQWNPFVRSVSGEVVPGNQISVKLHLPGHKEITMKPVVLEFKDQEILRWIGHLGTRGLFDGEHVFRIFDHHDGTVTFEQSEYFSGLLAPLIFAIIRRDTRTGFLMMNQKLKEMVLEKVLI